MEDGRHSQNSGRGLPSPIVTKRHAALAHPDPDPRGVDVEPVRKQNMLEEDGVLHAVPPAAALHQLAEQELRVEGRMAPRRRGIVHDQVVVRDRPDLVHVQRGQRAQVQRW